MIADGTIHSTHDIRMKIDEFQPGIVGIGILTPTYQEGRAIAEYAHEKGAKVVFGNDHASIMAEQIVKTRNYVDYVVKAEDGGAPFSYIVGVENGPTGMPPAPGNVGNRAKVLFRQGRSVASLEFPEKRLVMVPDFGFVPKDDMGRYAENYNKRYSRFHKRERTPGLINNATGCSNGKHPCIYCGIYDLGIDTGPAAHFWKMVADANEKYGMDFFMETYDNFLSSPRYVKALLGEMDRIGINPAESGIEFEVYSRADDILAQKEAIGMLKKMNVTRVNLGIDSGDDGILVALGKNMNRHLGMRPSEINYRAIEMVANAGMTFQMSFVLGARGETQESLGNTVEFVRAVAKNFPNAMALVEASELAPLPNSPSWKIMYGNAPIETDEPDMQAVVGEWLRRFTKVSMGMIDDAKEQIGKIAGEHGIARNSFFG
jgi:radical SAM superfamily enzyme YgiQ (UPF0313 family)